jgi:hypothetical protein
MPTKSLRALRISKACALRFSKGILLALACTLGVAATAQPTWRFHLAFEDGTGARDTIWFVFDSTATIGEAFGEVDLQLGEGAVTMDPDVFNVWLVNSSVDSTKTIAFPYTMFPDISAEIHAFNYQFPMIWRWDTALFRLPWLPEPGFSIDAGEMINDYFFFEFNNDPWGHEFYLGRDDSVLVQPSLPNTYVFPTIVNLGVENDIGMADFLVDNGPLIVPNPGLDHVRLKDAETVREIHVFGMEGRPCLQWSKSGTQADLNLSDLPMGHYLFRILRTDGSWQQLRWIKSRQP